MSESPAARLDMALPPHAIACALELVGAVRDRHPNQVAHTLRSAEKVDGLAALAVTLAAMVDDSRTVEQLLAWTTNQDVIAWRKSLTDVQCREYRNAYLRGYRTQDVLDGYREFGRRHAARKRKKASQRLRSVA